MLRKACLLLAAPCQLQPYSASTGGVKYTFHPYENYSLIELTVTTEWGIRRFQMENITSRNGRQTMYRGVC
jgi:hypothetical protein